jgi:hypothetical protein
MNAKPHEYEQLHYQVKSDIEKLKKQNVIDIPGHVIKNFKDGTFYVIINEVS